MGEKAGDGHPRPWFRAGRAQMSELLGRMTGYEPRVAAWVVRNIGPRNRVRLTQGRISSDDAFFAAFGLKAPGRTATTSALRFLCDGTVLHDPSEAIAAGAGRREEAPTEPSVTELGDGLIYLSFEDEQDDFSLVDDAPRPPAPSRPLLPVPFLARADRGVYIVNPDYLFTGKSERRQALGAEFAEASGIDPRRARAEWARRSRGAKAFLKADRGNLVGLLAGVRGREANVVARLVDEMDVRDNVVAATRATLAKTPSDRAPLSVPEVAKALRTLRGDAVAGGRRVVPALVIRDGHGHLMVNPAYLFYGGDDRGERLRREFRRLEGPAFDAQFPRRR